MFPMMMHDIFGLTEKGLSQLWMFGFAGVKEPSGEIASNTFWMTEDWHGEKFTPPPMPGQ